MSVRQFPIPDSMKRGIAGTCKWCGQDGVKKPSIYWHPACVEQFLLHTQPDAQKRHLIDRDGRRCAECGDVPQKWRASGVTKITCLDVGWRCEAELAETLWPHPEGRWEDLTHEQRHTGDQQSVERVCALEVDHRVPLWSIAHLPPDERRAYFGPTNLWLLCPSCHKFKSRLEAAARAAAKRSAA